MTTTATYVKSSTSKRASSEDDVKCVTFDRHYMAWNDRIRSAREKSGIPQVDLSLRLGKGSSTLGRWERAANEPSLTDLVALAEQLEVSVQWIATGDECGPAEEEFSDVLPADTIRVKDYLYQQGQIVRARTILKLPKSFGIPEALHRYWEAIDWLWESETIMVQVADTHNDDVMARLYRQAIPVKEFYDAGLLSNGNYFVSYGGAIQYVSIVEINSGILAIGDVADQIERRDMRLAELSMRIHAVELPIPRAFELLSND